MEYDELTQCTQGVVDPRRMGRNNSGLNEADISDVMCILHPCSPAAFKIVASTSERTPYNVLQNDGLEPFDDALSQAVLEEQETFILGQDGPHQAMDLALRFSAPTKNPKYGFIFGRNESVCDIVLAADTFKRVSNLHFCIFINNSGVLMLQDMSTNGTIVDDVLLRGKTSQEPQTRMLNPGSMLQILSPTRDEIVKFIVRIPSREGHIKEYEAKFQAYMRHVAVTEAKAKNNMLIQRFAGANTKTHNGASIKAPIVQNQFGMHWSGGDKYNVVGLIGKGAFATVYQLATKSEGQLFAAKELEKRKFMKNGILDRKLDNEMQIMKAVNHQNIVQYIDYQDHANHMYIIMEFVPCGDLAQYLVLHGPLPESLGHKIAAQVLDALAYLHTKKITHRDIKPDNILIANMDEEQFTVKLSDFGLSKVVKDNETFLKTFCGTLLYCAPEVFPHYDAHVAGKGNKRPRKSTARQTKYHGYSQSVDIWSFGAVLWYALCLKPPFEGVADNTGRGMFDKIMMTPLDVTDLARQGISDDFVALLVDMLNTDPASRPSPVECLRYRWLSTTLQSASQQAREGALDDGLLSIAEEEECEADDEPDVSGLSLDELDSSHESPVDEVSIHSGSLEFLDPRESKRFKYDPAAYREHDKMLDSSSDLYSEIPIMHQPTVAPSSEAQPQMLPKRLFGEVMPSELNSSGRLATTAVGILGSSRVNDGENTIPSSEANGQNVQAGSAGAVASPSLLGAESMVRDMNMDSPHSTNSPGAEPVEPITPKTPGVVERGSTRHGFGSPSQQHDDEITPKQLQQPTFNRQIHIPIPASFYYDPGDPTTHNLEYASKVSGRDYLNNTGNAEVLEETSSAQTVSGSATENEEEADLAERSPVEGESTNVPTTNSQFVKPPPRLGKLTSTPDSFVAVTLNLSARMSTWGRMSLNTHPYPDRQDARVPKRGIIIKYNAKNIDEIPEEDQRWMKLPDLHCVVSTESSQGLWINGVPLRKGEKGKEQYGRIYTGDEIAVCQKTHDGKPGLKFTCEFYHGEAVQQRPAGASRFRVEIVGQSQRPGGKEGGTALSAESVAAVAA